MHRLLARKRIPASDLSAALQKFRAMSTSRSLHFWNYSPIEGLGFSLSVLFLRMMMADTCMIRDFLLESNGQMVAVLL